MEKMKMHTPNRADENFHKLAELFPNAVTESIDENGEVVRAIDKDVLMQEINTKVVEGREERYQFTWPDKKKSVLLANAPINKTLRPCREESVGKDGTNGGFDSENLYIEGDNLEVLKLLQETYLGKIKMIYIDPPYNTGNDFIYNDNFKMSNEEWNEVSGDYDDEGNRLVKNLESNGSFHTDWLNMMYPRLKLAKDLLTDDGIIFISIDDNEQENLKKICDEIFGIKNFVANVVWKRKRGRDNSARWFSRAHEYCLIYAKNKDNFNIKFLELDDETKKAYKNPDNDPRGKYRILGCWARGTQGGVKYDFVTKNDQYFSERLWLFSKENLKKLDDDNKLIIRGDNIYRKMFLYENKGNIPETLWDNVSNAANASDEIKKLFENIIFDTSKPIPYITRMLRISTDKNDTILDFFSGSATTAHAVMQLNAEDGGNRKFIMVQIPELTYDGKKEKYKDKNGEEKERYIIDEETGYPIITKDSEARKAGYWTIPQIGKERIRRAGQKIRNEQLEKMRNEELEISNGKQLSLENSSLQTPNSSLIPDIGFRVLKCDSSNMKDVYYNPAEFDEIAIDGSIDNIKEDRTPEDLLFQVMLDLGVLLSSKIEEKIIDGKKVFDVAEGFLVACFDDNITQETITEIAKQQPYYFVMRDSSIANDSVATNFEQIFATYSPDTVRKVL